LNDYSYASTEMRMVSFTSVLERQINKVFNDLHL
jgi:hypothetical protein